MSNRVEFDLTRKRYGHHRVPKALPTDPGYAKAEVMTWEQFNALYEKFKAELGDKWMGDPPITWQERQQRCWDLLERQVKAARR